MTRLLWLWLFISVPLWAQPSVPAQQPVYRSANDYVLDVTVLNEQQLEGLLSRAETLQKQFSPAQHGRISIVLHGPELNLIAGERKQQTVINRLRQLDDLQGVDVMACRSRLRSLDLPESELPDFVQSVPLAPLEIQNLLMQGYNRL